MGIHKKEEKFVSTDPLKTAFLDLRGWREDINGQWMILALSCVIRG